MQGFDIENDIQNLVEALRAGDTILYPTETVWGLGCDVRSEQGIEAIFALKQRPKEKRFVLLVDSIERLEYYIAKPPQKALRLIEYFERPLTIIYDGAQHLPPSLLAADGSVAIRVTHDPHCKALVASLGSALVSTSANISGQDFPRGFADIPASMCEGVGAVANYRREEISENSPSAIVRAEDGEDLVFIRK